MLLFNPFVYTRCIVHSAKFQADVKLHDKNLPSRSLLFRTSPDVCRTSKAPVKSRLSLLQALCGELINSSVRGGLSKFDVVLKTASAVNNTVCVYSLHVKYAYFWCLLDSKTSQPPCRCFVSSIEFVTLSQGRRQGRGPGGPGPLN